MHASSHSQLQQQIAWNRQSAAAWHEVKHHRQQVGHLLQSLATGAAVVKSNSAIGIAKRCSTACSGRA